MTATETTGPASRRRPLYGATAIAAIMVAIVGLFVWLDEHAPAVTLPTGLSHVPADAYGVMWANLDDDSIEGVLEIFEQIPAWASSETPLPEDADDVWELALFGVLEDTGVDVGDVEAWLGSEFGAGLLRSTIGLSSFGGSSPPVFGWAESTNDAAAEQTLSEFSGVRTTQHRGITIHHWPSHGLAIYVADGVVMATSSRRFAEELIDVHAGQGERLLDAADFGQFIDGSGDADAGWFWRAQTTVDETAKTLSLLRGEPGMAETVELLESAALSEFLPDWFGGDLRMVESGVRFTARWPTAGMTTVRDLPEQVGSVPAATTGVLSQVVNGSPDSIGRMQALWREVARIWELDIADLPALCTDPELTEVCEAAVPVLELALETDALTAPGASVPHGATAVMFGSGPERDGAVAIVDGWPVTVPAVDNRLMRALKRVANTVGLIAEIDGDRREGSVSIGAAPGSIAASALDVLRDPAVAPAWALDLDRFHWRYIDDDTQVLAATPKLLALGESVVAGLDEPTLADQKSYRSLLGMADLPAELASLSVDYASDSDSTQDPAEPLLDSIQWSGVRGGIGELGGVLAVASQATEQPDRAVELPAWQPRFES